MALENLGPLCHSQAVQPGAKSPLPKPSRLPRGMDAAAFENERLNLETLLVNGTDDA